MPGVKILEKTVDHYLRSLDTFNSRKEIPASIVRGAALGMGCLNKVLL